MTAVPVEHLDPLIEALRFATAAGFQIQLHHREALRNMARLIVAVREECHREVS